MCTVYVTLPRKGLRPRLGHLRSGREGFDWGAPCSVEPGCNKWTTLGLYDWALPTTLLQIKSKLFLAWTCSCKKTLHWYRTFTLFTHLICKRSILFLKGGKLTIYKMCFFQSCKVLFLASLIVLYKSIGYNLEGVCCTSVSEESQKIFISGCDNGTLLNYARN